jgi:hypothetical protein
MTYDPFYIEKKIATFEYSVASKATTLTIRGILRE